MHFTYSTPFALSFVAATFFNVSASNSAKGVTPVQHKCSHSENVEERMAACNAVIESNGAGPQTYVYVYMRGAVWLSKNECEKAIADTDRSVAMQPKRDPYWNDRKVFAKMVARQRAVIYSACSHDYDAALTAINEAITSYPKDTNLYRDRANIQLRRNEPEKASSDFARSIELADFKDVAYSNLAASYEVRRELDRALENVNRALSINSKNSEAYNIRGNIFVDKGDYESALRDFNEAIRLNPKQFYAYKNRADLFLKQGQLDKALSEINEAIAREEKSTSQQSNFGYSIRGDIFRFKGEYQSALDDFNRVIADKRGGDFIRPLVSRGLTYERMGDMDRAKTDFKKAVSIPGAAASSADLIETARARLAALESGVTQPVIPASPSSVVSTTSVPTPILASPKPLTLERAEATAKQGRRVALVIGNSAYQNAPPLLNPQKDATVISAALKNIGFDVVTLAADQTREQMIKALQNFADEAEKSEWAMVYYAGHGMEVGGVNYLIPIDAKIKVDRDIQFEAVPLAQVLNAADTAKKIKLVMLDACRDNPFKPRQTAAPEVVAASMSTAGAPITTRSTAGRGLAEVKVTGATLVVYAAKDGQVALDGEGGNSPFAVAVANRLATPGVEINKLFRLVRDDVMEATASRQEPYTYGSLPGKEDFFFVSK